MTSPIVSVDWLAAHLHDPNIAIVDCRFNLMQPDVGRQHYQSAHIPGAYYLDLNQDLSSPVTQHGGRHPLPNPETLAAKLRSLGINSTPTPTLVILYDDSRLAFAARGWWLLRYLGHTSVALLDGGWTAWMTAGHPITADTPSEKAGNFSPAIQPDRLVDITHVQARKDHSIVALVDSRDPDRYRGEREPIDPIAGHIPGAVNYPWQEAIAETGLVRSTADHQQRWQSLAAHAEIIVYCGSGVTACVNLLSLELAGLSTGKLYAGSWSDWCSYQEPG